jgi:methionyl-tRNA formyltransferase
LKILFLGPPDSSVLKAIPEPIYDQTELPLANAPDVDLVLSHRYKHIVPAHTLSESRARWVNVHGGLTYHHRGVYPNFFSWLHGFTSGVTLHLMDEGIDTGPILNYLFADFPDKDILTLRNTWEMLDLDAASMVKREWKMIIGENPPAGWLKPTYGDLYTRADFRKYWPRATKGWDTPVKEIAL